MNVKSIRVNAILNIIYTISNIVFPMITFPYVSRILLADGMGKVSFFTAVANYAIMIASLGISTYGIRATAKVRDNKYELSKTVAELLIINVSMTAVVLAMLFVSIPLVGKFQDDVALLIINSVLIIGSALGINWLYSGLEQYSYITKRSIIFKMISLILVFLFVHKRSDYAIYAAIVVFSSTGSYLINFIYARKFVSFRNLGKLNLAQHLKPMMLLFASSLAVNVYTNLDTVMLGFISGDREVGLYTVAVKVKWLLLAVINAISAVLLPRLSYYISEKKTEEFKRILKKSIVVIFMLSIPLSVFFNMEARNSILLLGGEDYVGATLCMRIVLPILLISGFSNITGNQILIPLGKDSCFMKAIVAGSLVDLVMNVILMPKYGAVGAAVATLIAECTQMSIQLHFAKDYIWSNIQKKPIMKILFSTLIAMVVVSGLKYVLNVHIGNYTVDAFVNLMVDSVVFFGMYSVIMLLTKEVYFRELIISLVRRR